MKPFALTRLFAPLLLILVALAVLAVPAARASTPNVAVGAGQVMVLPFHISGQYTATTASVARFAMPQPCELIGVGASARASGGTAPTLTVDVKSANATVLSAPITVTAGAYSHGTITTSNIPDEAAVTLDLAIGGTSPTWNDITVVLTCSRK